MTRFAPLENDLLLRAARRQPTGRTPVWMMRQAGRYLPEYRALRAEEAFFDVCRTPELAAEATLQPLERFDVDAAIIFSDILVVPQAMGMEVVMIKGAGPTFPEPLTSPEHLPRLKNPDVRRDLDYVLRALTLARERLAGRVPLIGFCGGPWTLMAYMVEGSGGKQFSRVRSWIYRHPAESEELLSTLSEILAEYLIAQIEAGAQAVQIFESWAGLLGPAEFESFVLPCLREIAARVGQAHPAIPKIIFARGAHYALKALSDSPYEVIGLDWTMRPAEVRSLVGGRQALQGNLDPAVLYAAPEVIRREVRQMLKEFGRDGYIANLGHGMHPDHDPEHARIFVDTVHELSEELK